MHEKFIPKCLSHSLRQSTIHFYLVKGKEILLQGKITPLVFHFPGYIPSSGFDVKQLKITMNIFNIHTKFDMLGLSCMCCKLNSFEANVHTVQSECNALVMCIKGCYCCQIAK